MRQRKRRRPATPSIQLAGMGGVGLVAGGLFGLLHSAWLAPIVGWDSASLGYLIWTWVRLWPLDPRQTAELAVREDPSRALRDGLLLGAGVASLVAVGFILVAASRVRGYQQELYAALGILTVVLSWAVVHTIFTARYARIYFTGPNRGIDFREQSPPRYTDFAYVSFTVGMTFQISDTDLTSHEMRATALRHALLSYLFGSIIIASTINLLAGLIR